MVIPAKAGIQHMRSFWTPAFAGVTVFLDFFETVNFDPPVTKEIVKSGS
jgi:hypothetical protein